MNAKHFLMLDASSKVIGSGYTPDGTVPENGIACTAEQAATPMEFTVVDGVILNPSPEIMLAKAKLKLAAEISAACAAAITGGFQSSALGSVHTYPSSQTDQANLAANVLSSMYPNLPANWQTPQMCCDAAGHWGYVAHSAVQIQQVGIDGKAAISACLLRNKALQDAISSAVDTAAIESLVW